MHRPKSAIARSSRAGITRYLQLYHHLAQELADGRFRPDVPLLSEPELVKLHRVSRTTVRRALDRLEKEGRIERRRGSGTYAREVEADSRLELDLHELCDLNSRGGTAKVLESGVGPVPRSLQSRHDALGPRARLLRRLRSRRGEAFQLESVYLCKANGTVPKIERVVHEISAVTADSPAARHLGVTVGTPLLRLRSEFIGRGERLLAISDSVVRCDRASLHADMVRNGHAGRWLLKRG